jgi:hypothetical protein
LLCLLLQFIEDLSDRELERFIAENASAKWFCNSAYSITNLILHISNKEVSMKELSLILAASNDPER